jgi:hypothetical protein
VGCDRPPKVPKMFLLLLGAFFEFALMDALFLVKFANTVVN